MYSTSLVRGRSQPSPLAVGLPDPTIHLSGDWPEALHSPFVRQAQRRGEKVAIVGHNQLISYALLDQLSNRLANYLCDQGCSGKVVAIYAVRSPTLVWAILGILKAGAAFTVFDSGYPPARLAQYSLSAMPSMLINISEAGSLPEELAGVTTKSIILPKTLAAVSQVLGQYPDSAPNVEVGPHDLTYVMFTSGSTGKPKGLLGIHAPPAHFMAWHCLVTFGFTEKDHFSMLSGLAHDIVLRDIFAPLHVGATLHIPHPDDFSPGRMPKWMKDNSITVAHLTPPSGSLISAASDVNFFL